MSTVGEVASPGMRARREGSMEVAESNRPPFPHPSPTGPHNRGGADCGPSWSKSTNKVLILYPSPTGRRPGVATGFRHQPLRELAHVRLSGGEPRFDDEIRPRSHQRLLERHDQRAGFDQIVEQRLTAERHALSADRRLDHLLVLAEVQRARGSEVADAERGEPGAPIHVHRL